jgi:hypothetical protein
MDKVMMFTDCQMWNSNGDASTIENSWNKYKQLAPNAKLYLFDLTGYGNVPINFKRSDVCLIAGWSDKIFGILDSIENGSDAVKKINAVTL